eukprot:CCRYP_012785-RB/>CCRYP_012785-RB protein AED:0.04 eAED:0.04 QI:155/1/1/1/1/1/3/119/577
MSSPRNHLPRHIFPIPYQVDFTEENKGRHLDSTKRKICWKFGFAHPPAIFPHLFDENENYVGYREGVLGGEAKVGVDCRGREHEITLLWSLVSGKAHLYVDNKEIYRHDPPSDEILNPFTAQFHKGFNLPNSKYNGHHRIDIRCYSRIPLGAKNMVVDNVGGKFHQYDLTVDGLSYFSMPAMYELGTEKMWRKVEKWGMFRMESRISGDNCTSSSEDDLRNTHTKTLTDTYNELNGASDVRSNGQQHQRTGRLVDEYYFDKAKPRSRSYDQQYRRSISRGEYNAMTPRNESEEERMMRIAMEASIRDLDYNGNVKPEGNSARVIRDDSSSSNRIQRTSTVRQVKSESNTPRLAAVGENEDLIDFGDDDVNNISRGVSQIAFSQHLISDVSVLGDDDATTASFMVPVQPGVAGFQQQQPYFTPVSQPYPQQPPVQPTFQDPTFNSYSSGSTPRTFNDAASFAFAPPPTWDDYKNAFGGSVSMNMGASVAGGSTGLTTSMMSPLSASSPINTGISFTAPQQPQFQQQQPQQYGAYSGTHIHFPQNQWQTQSYGAASQQPAAAYSGKKSMFDPLRQDPFA